MLQTLLVSESSFNPLNNNTKVKTADVTLEENADDKLVSFENQGL